MPNSLLCATALLEFLIVALVTVAVGAVVSFVENEIVPVAIVDTLKLVF